MIIVEIAGHLGRDPETRFTPSGLKVTNLTVATNIRKGGKDETVWWRVTLWGERFDKMMPYLKKGSAVIVMGEMSKPTIYTDKEGRPQISMEMTAEIIKFNPFGGSDREGREGGNAAQQSHGQPQGQPHSHDSHGDFGGASKQASTVGAGAGTGYAGFGQEAPNEEPLPF